MMRFSDIDRHPASSKLRQFGLLCLVAGCAAIPRFGWAPAVVGGVAALAGIVRPAWLRPIFVGASIAAFPAGWLISRLILGLVFFGIVTPIAIVFRLAGRDRAGIRTAAPRWIGRNEERDPRSYFRQF